MSKFINLFFVYKIVIWQAQIRTINEATELFSAVQQNGTDVHKYIAAKNIEKELADVDNIICQAKELKFDSMSFSFDKEALLQNVGIVVNNVNKSLADIDGAQKTQQEQPFRPKRKSERRSTMKSEVKPNAIANLATKTMTVNAPEYNYGQQPYLHQTKDLYFAKNPNLWRKGYYQ